ncbi:MAG TPA: hypothetical protein VF026_17365 [Ktedonobacteraceae bacterium]
MSFRTPKQEKEIPAGRGGISPKSRRKGCLDHKVVAPGVLTPA